MRKSHKRKIRKRSNSPAKHLLKILKPGSFIEGKKSKIWVIKKAGNSPKWVRDKNSFSFSEVESRLSTFEKHLISRSRKLRRSIGRSKPRRLKKKKPK